MSFERTVSESENCTTVLPESELSVLSTQTVKLKENKVPVTSGGTDMRFSYALQTSVYDAPLINITDNVVHPLKDSAEVSAVDMCAVDMYSINSNLQKSILIPLKIQVIVFPSCYGNIIFA